MFSTATTQEEPLPQHWEMRVDHRTGLPYYLNHMDQYTTWDDPRLVGRPRAMLNNMHFRPSPEPQQRQRVQRTRQASVEPTSAADRYYSMPGGPEDFYSLPRRAGMNRLSNQPTIMRDPFQDDFFTNFRGFHDHDSFFGEPSWPNKFHTIQRTHQPRARSMQPPPRCEGYDGVRGRGGHDQTYDDSDVTDGTSIPITNQARETGERVIIPTQYKRKQENSASSGPKLQQQKISSENTVHENNGKASPKPKHKQRQQGPICDDSNEDSILQRMNSVKNDQEEFEQDGSAADQASRRMSVDSTTPCNDRSAEGNAHRDQVPSPKPIPSIVVEEHVEPEAQEESVDMEDKSELEPSTAEPEPEYVAPPEATEEETMDGVEKEEPVEDDGANDELDKAIASSMSQIDKVIEEADEYKKQVEEFKGKKNSKEYRLLDEMLTRCQLALDNVETHGSMEVRKRRKSTVNYIESIIRILESRAEP